MWDVLISQRVRWELEIPVYLTNFEIWDLSNARWGLKFLYNRVWDWLSPSLPIHWNINHFTDRMFFRSMLLWSRHKTGVVMNEDYGELIPWEKNRAVPGSSGVVSHVTTAAPHSVCVPTPPVPRLTYTTALLVLNISAKNITPGQKTQPTHSSRGITWIAKCSTNKNIIRHSWKIEHVFEWEIQCCGMRPLAKGDCSWSFGRLQLASLRIAA